MLKSAGIKYKIQRERDKMFLSTNDAKKTSEILKRVFGLHSFAIVEEVKTDYKEIEKIALKFAKKIKPNETFAIRCHRNYKKFPLTSMQVESKIGAKIRRKCNLTNPDKTIYIVIRRDKSYIYSEIFNSAGGLPVGVSGKVLCLISGGIDSPVAAWLMMKRGCSEEFIYFDNQPFTDKKDRQRVIEILKVLKKYYPRKIRLHIVPFSKIQESVINTCNLKFGCVLGRKIMFRISEIVAEKIGAQALVTGDNLAQVASQTLSNLRSEQTGIKIPVLMPLIGMDKIEIIDMSKKIGTYDISIKIKSACPLTPKSPATKSDPSIIKKEERKIKKNIIEKTIKNIEVLEI
jgi:thiamine biosynthesis protein ThiI